MGSNASIALRRFAIMAKATATAVATTMETWAGSQEILLTKTPINITHSPCCRRIGLENVTQTAIVVGLL